VKKKRERKGLSLYSTANPARELRLALPGCNLQKTLLKGMGRFGVQSLRCGVLNYSCNKARKIRSRSCLEMGGIVVERLSIYYDNPPI
jgi:hypothetical protein